MNDSLNLLVTLKDEQAEDLISIAVAFLLLSIIVLFLFYYLRQSFRLSRFALPDYLPKPEAPNDSAFGKTRAYFGGSYIKNARYLGLPICLLGKGHSTKGMGHVWLASETLIFKPYLGRSSVLIPYAIIQNVEIRRGLFYGKYIGANYIQLIWGRKELPIGTGLVIYGGIKMMKHWVEEILRRADVSKQK